MKHSDKISRDPRRVTRDRNRSFTDDGSRITHRARALSLGLIVLASAVITHAVTADPKGNPYEPIVGRNVFSLKPPTPPPNPEDLIKKEPPPKIRLQGLTTILGRRQVLFKVQAPAKPGAPAKEESFVLSQGERQGEIEVVEIDEQAGTVKFNNHSIQQSLNMKDDADKPVVAALPPGFPQPGAVPGALPGVPPPPPAFNQAAPAGGSVTTFGGSGSKPIPTRPMRMDGGVPGSAFGAAQTAQTAGTTQTGPPLSVEEQEVLIEVKKKLYQDQGDPRARIMPPTSMTPRKEQ